MGEHQDSYIDRYVVSEHTLSINESVDEWDTFVVAKHTGMRVEHKGNSVFWCEQRVNSLPSLIAEGVHRDRYICCG